MVNLDGWMTVLMETAMTGWVCLCMLIWVVRRGLIGCAIMEISIIVYCLLLIADIIGHPFPTVLNMYADEYGMWGRVMIIGVLVGMLCCVGDLSAMLVQRPWRYPRI